MTSLETFRQEYAARFLDIHWRQWSTLGVASPLGRESEVSIDLEALLVSTLRLGLADKRLLTTAADWVAQNRQWLNPSRLNGLARQFGRAERPLAPVVAIGDVVSLYLQYLKSGGKAAADTATQPGPELPVATQQALGEYREIFEMTRRKGATVTPNLQEPSLLQLYLRGVFGINARAEILVFLLSRKRGNSNNIAKEIGFDQKIVYRVLERWAAAGFVEKADGRDFRLSPAVDVEAALPFPELPRYINWIGGFSALGRILTAIETDPFANDEYLLSSAFRDVLPDVKILAGTIEISLSHERLYPGAAYFEVFSSEILAVLERLNRI